MSMLIKRRLLDTDWCQIVGIRLGLFPAKRSWHRAQDFGIERAMKRVSIEDRVNGECGDLPRFLCLQVRHQPTPRIDS